MEMLSAISKPTAVMEPVSVDMDMKGRDSFNMEYLVVEVITESSYCTLVTYRRQVSNSRCYI